MSSSRLSASDAAFIRTEIDRLAGLTADELEAEGARWRWGLMGECRAQIYMKYARRARRRGVERLGELGTPWLRALALRINWL